MRRSRSSSPTTEPVTRRDLDSSRIRMAGTRPSGASSYLPVGGADRAAQALRAGSVGPGAERSSSGAAPIPRGGAWHRGSRSPGPARRWP
jgi:hypothetical protein